MGSVRGYESYSLPIVVLEDGTEFRAGATQTFSNNIELSFPLVPKAKMRLVTYFDWGFIGNDNISEFLEDIKLNKPLIIDTSPTNGNTPALFGSVVKNASIETIKEFIQDNYIQKDVLQSNGWIIYEFNWNTE